MGFLMIPLTTLYDDYIDRPKLSEQKNPFEYLVPPPLKWVGTIIKLFKLWLFLFKAKIIFKSRFDIRDYAR